MLNFFRILYQLQFPYSDELERQQARDLLRALIAFGVLVILNLTLVILLGASNPIIAPSSIIGLIIAIVSGYQVQTGQLRNAQLILVFGLTVLVGLVLLDGIRDFVFVSFIIPLSLAGLLLRRNEIVIVFALIALTFWLAVSRTETLSINIVQQQAIIVLIVVGSLGVTTMFFVVFGGGATRLAVRNQRDLSQFRKLVETDIFDKFDIPEADLILEGLSLIRTTLSYEVTQIYLLDDAKREAQRVYSGFGLGKLQYGERVSISAATGIGEGLRTRETIIINVESSITRKRALSAGMKQAILVPLRYGDSFLGLLDVQTSSEERLSANQIQMVEAYARHFDSAIVRGRILKQLREDVSEQERIILKQRQNLRELEQARPGALANSWQDFFQQHTSRMMGFDVDIHQAQAVPASDLDDEMREALASGDIVIKEIDNRQLISLPIMLREELLGAMSFRLLPNVFLTERQTELLRSVIQRLALALENKRLFEQSQSQALRESTANAAASVLLTSTDIQTVLQLASQVFNDSLGAVKTQIYLQPPMAETTEGTAS